MALGRGVCGLCHTVRHSPCREGFACHQDQLKPSSLLGTKAANVAKKRKKGPSLFMPTSLKKKVRLLVVCGSCVA